MSTDTFLSPYQLALNKLWAERGGKKVSPPVGSIDWIIVRKMAGMPIVVPKKHRQKVSTNQLALLQIRDIYNTMTKLTDGLQALEAPTPAIIEDPSPAIIDDPSPAIIEAPAQSATPFICSDCGSAHKTKHLLKYHIAANHTKKCFECPCGNFTSPILGNVYQHAAAKHCKEWLAPFKLTDGKCKYCSKHYASSPSYRQHCFTCPAALQFLSPTAKDFRERVMNLKC